MEQSYFQMRVSSAFLRRLDDWRRLQKEIPSRSAAIRTLVERGIAEDMAKHDEPTEGSK